MDIELPPDAIEVFNKAYTQYAVEDGKVLAYGLKSVTIAIVQEVCDQAIESYAKEILNWPSGRIAKPDIFSRVNQGTFENLGDCSKHFVRYLRDLLDSSPPKQIPTYPFAFITISEDEIPSNAILVLAYKSRGLWQLEYRPVPVKVKLCSSVDSLRLGDETPEDILDQYACGPAKTTSGKYNSQPTDTWAFAVFSTGLARALPLLALLDPSTDEVRPSEATHDLIDDPETSRFLMPYERMKELFPIICRDDERRGWRTNGMKLHKKAFICCDNNKPEELGS